MIREACSVNILFCAMLRKRKNNHRKVDKRIIIKKIVEVKVKGMAKTSVGHITSR